MEDHTLSVPGLGDGVCDPEEVTLARHQEVGVTELHRQWTRWHWSAGLPPSSSWQYPLFSYPLATPCLGAAPPPGLGRPICPEGECRSLSPIWSRRRYLIGSRLVSCMASFAVSFWEGSLCSSERASGSHPMSLCC